MSSKPQDKLIGLLPAMWKNVRLLFVQCECQWLKFVGLLLVSCARNVELCLCCVRQTCVPCPCIDAWCSKKGHVCTKYLGTFGVLQKTFVVGSHDCKTWAHVLTRAKHQLESNLDSWFSLDSIWIYCVVMCLEGSPWTTRFLPCHDFQETEIGSRSFSWCPWLVQSHQWSCGSRRVQRYGKTLAVKAQSFMEN